MSHKKCLLSAVLFLTIFSTVVHAQLRRSSFRVESPAALQGYLMTTEITDQGANAWGTGIYGTWENVPVAYDLFNPDGCGPFAPGYFTGKFALIYRGACEYGLKALNAQQAGATGVIMVNNLMGVTGMGAGANGGMVTIPVIMVTLQAGNSMRNQILNNLPVNVSLTSWRFDSILNPQDIGFMSDGPIHPWARAIPSHQCSTNLGMNVDDSFRVYAGGRMYNYSFASIDTISLEGRLDYNANFIGGTFAALDSNKLKYYYNPPAVNTDSIFYLQLDSINNVQAGFDMNDAPKGIYKMKNKIFTNPNTETFLNLMNNEWIYNFAVTDSVYSKCEYNFANNSPVVSNYVVSTPGITYYWGSVYYIRNGSYEAKTGQAVVMRNIIDDSVFTGEEVEIQLFKWNDLNGDNIIEYASELDQVAQAVYTLTANDIIPIAGKTITAPFMNIIAPGQPVILDSNSRYWMAVTLDANNIHAIGSDYYSDYSANLAMNVSNGNPLYDVVSGIMYPGGFAKAGSPSLAMIMSECPGSINISNLVNVSCNGQCDGSGQALIVGGLPNYTYAITNPGVINANTGAMSNLCAGFYTVTASNGGACAASTVMVVTQPNVLTVSLSNLTQVSCNGLCNGSAQIVVNGGTPNFNYVISPMANINIATGAVTGMCPGTYTVTVTDANNCTATTSVTVTQPAVLSVAVSNITDASCNALCDGTAQATGTGGNPSYVYSIAPAAAINANTGAATALCAGTYTISLTDGNGCSAATTLTVTEPAAIAMSISALINASAPGACDGSAQASATGGTPGFSYAISAPGIINNATGAISGLCAGTYTITTTDSKLCTQTTVINITEPTSINEITAFQGKASVYPNPAANHIFIKIDLDATSSKLSYEIVDIAGKTVGSDIFTDVKSEIFTYKTDQLSNGTYFVNINTDKGRTQLKFQIVR